MSDLATLLPSGLTPALTLVTMDRHLGWALTLAAVTLFLLRWTSKSVRFTLGVAVFLLALVPVNWGLSHWMGLAYQTPSLVTQGLALLYLYRALMSAGAAECSPASTDKRWPLSVLLVSIAAGWTLVLDTFAVLPVPLYALGYSTEAAVFGLVVAMVFWMVAIKRSNGAGDAQGARDLAIVLVLAIAIHTFTRLPSGNAWDAMLDPWLWLVSHGALIGRIVRLSRDKSGKAGASYDNAASSRAIKSQSPESTVT